MRPLVTAIVPTRNRAYCLPRAVESICAQEGRGELFDVEVIVVDDASSDTTPEVIRPYDAVRYVRLAENRGVAAATRVDPSSLKTRSGSALGQLCSPA